MKRNGYIVFLKLHVGRFILYAYINKLDVYTVDLSIIMAEYHSHHLTYSGTLFERPTGKAS